MILTDKCKEDFNEHYATSTSCCLLNNANVSDLPLIVQNALIIEWLDSVGLIVEVSFGKISKSWISNVADFTSIFNPSRSFATNEALKKANEIYNNLNTKENEK